MTTKEKNGVQPHLCCQTPTPLGLIHFFSLHIPLSKDRPAAAHADAFLNHTPEGEILPARAPCFTSESKPPKSKLALKHGWKHYGLAVITVMGENSSYRAEGRKGNAKIKKKRKIRTDES